MLQCADPLTNKRPKQQAEWPASWPLSMAQTKNYAQTLLTPHGRAYYGLVAARTVQNQERRATAKHQTHKKKKTAKPHTRLFTYQTKLCFILTHIDQKSTTFISAILTTSKEHKEEREQTTYTTSHKSPIFPRKDDPHTHTHNPRAKSNQLHPTQTAATAFTPRLRARKSLAPTTHRDSADHAVGARQRIPQSFVIHHQPTHHLIPLCAVLKASYPQP